jgi:predicted acyltransferase (DUF342 family)
MAIRYRSIVIAMAAALGMAVFAAVPAFAGEDRVSIGNDVVVADGTAMDDVVCILCSVKVHGTVQGDVVTVLGSVAVDESRSVAGDVVAVGGDVALGSNASVNGDVAVIAGDLQRAADASVHGDTSVEAGRGWLLLPLAPILILIGIVWLIVWFATRKRYTFPVYPQGRGL